MINYRSVSKQLVLLLAILLMSSCATSRVTEIKDGGLPVFQVGEKVRVYTRDNVVMEFEIHKVDSSFIYGKNDNPTVRKDEIKKVALLESKIRKYILYYVIGTLGLFLIGCC